MHRSPLAHLLFALVVLSFLAAGVPPAAMAAPVAPLATSVFINEIHYDNTGTDTGEAIEVAAPSGTDLTGWTVVLYNGNGGASYDTDSLGTVAGTCGSYDLYVINYASNGIQNGAPDGMALVNASNTVIQFLSYEGTFTATNGPANGTTSTDIGVSQGGNGAVGQSLQLAGTGTVYSDFTWQAEAASTFGKCNTGQVFGTPSDVPPTVSSTTPAHNATGVAVNAAITVNFSESVDVATGAFTVECPVGAPVTFSSAPVLPATGTSSVVLTPDANLPYSTVCTVTVDKDKVTDKDGTADNMATNHVFSFTTVAADVCSTTFTPIYSIQGSGSAAAITGAVTTQGVVVGDYEPQSGSGQIRGFYLQDLTGDSNPATSDGIFVYLGDSSVDKVAVGQVVRVSGTAGEYQEQTQISSVTSIVQCGTTGSVNPADITLPVASANALEPFEGMLVRFPQTLYVTEHYQLGRFGQIVMSSGARLRQPTNVALPGPAALAVQAANDLNRIIVDDDANTENPDPIKFGRGGSPLSASNTLRGGDTVTGLVGVLTYGWSGNSISGNAYRLRPIGALGGGSPVFTAANARPTAPGVSGRLRVTAANTLNYFNSFTGCTLGVDGAATNCRGAENATEFDRQWPKTVANLVGTGADVIGLMEIENDGYGSASAIQDLVDKLNAATVAGTYAFIDADTLTGQVNALGVDAIKVALIYKPAKVTPVGTTAVLNTVAFVNGGDSTQRNRPALAQAFEEVATGERFIVAVNHFKSKGSACDAPDAGDGQGNCNVVRTNAANALTAWLAGDPTGVADDDIVIMGDLNSYAKEDPITAIEDAGYINLIADRLGADAYSYAYDGQWGYLDHALGTATFNAQVAGVEEWHINADEPSVLDYNTNYKTAGQQASLYASDQYRSSDHDPVVIGLDLTPNNQGNLPVKYGAAWHIGAGGPFLGALWQSGAGTTDNDGVTRTPGVNWQAGTGGGSIDVTVTGATGYFSAWIDWNDDGDFADAGEFVINNQTLTVGAHTITFDIPAGVTFGTTFNARFRLYASSQTMLLAAGFGADAAPSPTGGASGGEVEDYTWNFGPNAVGLRSLTAVPLARPVWPLWAGLVGLTGLVFLRRRR